MQQIRAEANAQGYATSFGKSDLIFKYVLANYQEKNICIIVPTKALINQTRIQLYSLFKKEKNKWCRLAGGIAAGCHWNTFTDKQIFLCKAWRRGGKKLLRKST